MNLAISLNNQFLKLKKKRIISFNIFIRFLLSMNAMAQNICLEAHLRICSIIKHFQNY